MIGSVHYLTVHVHGVCLKAGHCDPGLGEGSCDDAERVVMQWCQPTRWWPGTSQT
jgi:hypothetical protein